MRPAALGALRVALGFGCVVCIVATGCHGDRPRRDPSAARASDARAGGFGLGRAATPEEIHAWDGDVLPDGTGLPDGSGTVAAGAQVYSTRCAMCHGLHGEGATAVPLVGGKEPALGFRVGRAPQGEPRPTLVDFFPYATILFDYTRRAMPWNASGSLSDDETYSVVAFMLSLNGLVAKDATLDKESLLRVEMPARARFAYDGDRAAPVP
jgi:cytochrome c